MDGDENGDKPKPTPSDEQEQLRNLNYQEPKRDLPCESPGKQEAAGISGEKRSFASTECDDPVDKIVPKKLHTINGESTEVAPFEFVHSREELDTRLASTTQLVVLDNTQLM